jgi:hypothetical protein
MEDELLNAIAGDYSSLSSTRNDINHNGMRSSHAPLEPEKLIRNIEKNMDSIFRKMNNPK